MTIVLLAFSRPFEPLWDGDICQHMSGGLEEQNLYPRQTVTELLGECYPCTVCYFL